MRRHVTVTVADSHAARIDDVVRSLRRAGMEVDGVLGTIGIVTGSVADEQLASIESLPGVAAVERQQCFRLAPPGADVQ